MVNSRTVKTAAALAVMFFLIFAGMRISLLDRSPKPKPKPKPRAVLNLSGKQASSVSSYETFPVQSIDSEPRPHHVSDPLWIATLVCTLFLAAHVVNPEIQTPHGRAPPRC